VILTMLNALTIDVEEHFQVHAFETVIDRKEWGGFASRVVVNTRRILEILTQHNTRATFFVLGWVADRHPDLVREIAGAGHELATHGYGHELIYRQTPAEFAEDIEKSVAALTRALNGSSSSACDLHLGYRAPAFSVTRRSLWALDVLKAHGIRYDSSIFPLVAHDRYGISDAQRFAHRLSNGLWEFPVSTVRMAGRNWPVAGGGYFRLFPLWLTRQSIRRINAEGQPAVIYLHPWELDAAQPPVPGAPLVSRFRHYVNLGKTEGRLHSLLREFRFASIREVFAGHLEGT